MNWKRVSSYCIGSEEGYKIDRSWSEGTELFGLSYQGQHLKYYRSSKAAKTAASKHAEKGADHG